MRPKSIVQFELLALSALGIGLLMAVFSWDETLATARSAGFGPGFVLSVTAFSLGVPLLLTLLVSRRASKVAKWVLIVMFVVGLAMMLANPETMFFSGARFIVQIVQTLLQAVSLALLFTEEARSWLGGRPDRST